MTHHEIMLKDGWTTPQSNEYASAKNGCDLEVRQAWPRKPVRWQWRVTRKGVAIAQGTGEKTRLSAAQMAVTAALDRVAAAVAGLRDAPSWEAVDAPKAPEQAPPVPTDRNGAPCCWHEGRVKGYRCHYAKGHSGNHLMMIPE